MKKNLIIWQDLKHFFIQELRALKLFNKKEMKDFKNYMKAQTNGNIILFLFFDYYLLFIIWFPLQYTFLPD